MSARPSQPTGPREGLVRRVPRIALVGLTVAALGVPALMAATVASAAVPTFPDNLLVFPNRDFISVAGYAEHAGETALVKVNRPGVGVVGSATAVVTGGDVAFEINHPGGVCWGNGTSLKVTPDILPGDTATISFGGVDAGDTTVSDAYAIEPPAHTAGSDTYVVTGHIGAGVDQTMLEQRTVNPDFTATTVGKRDIRAIPGPLTPAPGGGYSSSLEFNDVNHTFTATYVFDDPANAAIAASGGGERLLTWQVVDLAANRQGITIAEADQLGGPGMGGCPNGATQAGPVGPSSVLAANVAGGIKLTWVPAVAVPGTAPITGYRATAVAQTVNAAGEQVEIGRAINRQTATGTTITGLSATEAYDVKVVSVSSVGETFPAVHAIPETDVTPPTVAASPAGGTYALAQNVALTANELGSEIYYTTDGTDPVLGDILSASAVHYTTKVAITADTTLKYAAFDPTGNVSLIGQQDYLITNKPTPDAPTFGANTVGAGSITLNWTSADPSVTGYGVQLYDAAGLPVGFLQETPNSSLTITGLTPDTAYFATVQATNANGYGPASAKAGPLTPQGLVVANAGPDQTIVRKATATTVNLTAAGSTAGASYSWEQVLTGPTDPDKVTLTGAATASPSFSLATYKFPMTNNARTFRLTVTTADGVKTDDVNVTPRADTIAIGTAKWKLGDFRVTGTGTVAGGTVTIHKGTLAGVSLGTYAMTAAAPPATNGVFSARSTATVAPFNTNPGTIWVESSLGGTAGPFTVG
jgi:Chitobiase/beta-hexosaminidase C-terminal domain/Fibronectin type III domain